MTNFHSFFTGFAFRRGWLAAACLLGALSAPAQKMPKQLQLDQVFDMPFIQQLLTQDMTQAVYLGRLGRVQDMERILEQVAERLPDHPVPSYNLACAKARLGKTDEALEWLARAVDAGIGNAVQIAQDPDLATLRGDPRYEILMERAGTVEPFAVARKAPEPAPVIRGVARVTEKNTAWDPRTGMLRCLFVFPEEAASGEAVRGNGEARDRVRAWYQAGEAAGNLRDLYDNRDRGHSRIADDGFPQLSLVEYGAEAKWRELEWGTQTLFLYNAVTLGNASVAATSGPYWRSMARRAYVDPRAMGALHAQYRMNHLYVYPEHKDHDPGHNGDGGGYGDVFCANTPYLVISQGSSGSDSAFLSAFALTLAALRPDTKQALAEKGLLMPTLQMLLRTSNQGIQDHRAYLSGAAHPTVFDGSKLDPLRMVERAHAITPDRLPPLAVLDIVEEDLGLPGVDYFHPTPGETLWTTPHAIARVVRSMQYRRRMVLSAKNSLDANGRPLTYHWAVLRGNPGQIEIRPRNDERSEVEIVVSYHERFPVAPGARLESNRVDIGAFVHNGEYYSPPSFISLFYLDNEERAYDEEGRIRSVQYSGGETPGNYVEPLLDVPKDWRDEYHYGPDGELTGWTRSFRGESLAFTAEGRLLVDPAPGGREPEARPVLYLGMPGEDDLPVLVPVVATPREAVSAASAAAEAQDAPPGSTP
jgi:hypothetical protein